MAGLRKSLVLSALGVLLMATVQMAKADDLDCSNRDNLPQQDLNACADQDFETEDAALNKIWPEAKNFAAKQDESSDGDPSSADVLLKGQKAWLAYRDAQCALEGYAFRDGSMEPMLVSGCKAVLTQERVTHLREWINGADQ